MRILCWSTDVPRWTVCGVAGSCVVCMWFMGLRYVKQVYESIVLASSAVSMGVSVFSMYPLPDAVAADVLARCS